MLPSCFGSSTNDDNSGENQGVTPFTIGSMPKKQRFYDVSGIQKSVSATVTFEATHTGDGASDVELIDRGGVEGDWTGDTQAKVESDHKA